MGAGLRLVQPNNGGPGPGQQYIYIYIYIYICLKFCDFHAFYFTLFCIISVCILCRKNTKSGIKTLSFRQLKKKLKKEKKYFCAYGQVS